MWLAVAACLLGCRSQGPQRDPIGDARTAAACPAFLDLEFDGTASRFDPGWTGITHGVGLATGSRLSVQVDECEPDCRRCRFHGPVRGDPAKPHVINQRCLQNVSKICSGDGECGGEGPCRFVFPPIATTVSSTCTIAYFEPLGRSDAAPVDGSDPSPVQGIVNLQTGETDMPVLNLLLSLRQNGCVECIGDQTPFDGIAEGKCFQSEVACDLHGKGVAVPSSTSFDCPPGPEIKKIALGTNGTSTSTVVWKMDATRPLCTETNARDAMKRCWCGVCNDGTPCTTNKDCAIGTCGAAKSPANMNIAWNVANNSCPGKCKFDAATQHGTCTDNGRSCFPDDGEMVATGGAEVKETFLISQLANLICMPSFSAGDPMSDPIGTFVDAVGGFPGPFLFEARFRVETRSAP